MMGDARSHILLPVVVCWLAAMGALFLHPALWALFAVLAIFFAYRSWTRDAS